MLLYVHGARLPRTNKLFLHKPGRTEAVPMLDVKMLGIAIVREISDTHYATENMEC